MRVVGADPGNTSNVVLKPMVLRERRKIFEPEESDFGGGPRCHGSVFFHRNGWERETTDPKPTEADHDQSR